MKYKTLLNLTTKALSKHLSEFKRELFNLRVQKVLNTLKNTARMRHVRKSVARIYSILKGKK